MVSHGVRENKLLLTHTLGMYSYHAQKQNVATLYIWLMFLKDDFLKLYHLSNSETYLPHITLS